MQVSRRYDYVIIDCGPSLNLLNQNALSYADEVIIPVTCDYLALVGVKQVLRTIKDVERHLGHAVRVSAVLPTFYDGRTRLAREVLETLQGHFKHKCLEPIRHNTRLAEAPSHRKTIFEYAPTSHGAADYNRVVDWVLATTRTAETTHSPRARRPGGRLEVHMKDDKLMAHDPLSDADAILSEEYYGRPRTPMRRAVAPRGRTASQADALQGDLHLDVHARPRGARRQGRRAQAPRLDQGEQVAADPARARRRSISTSCRRRGNRLGLVIDDLPGALPRVPRAVRARGRRGQGRRVREVRAAS